MTDGGGAVRAARLTDRQALAELSRRVHASSGAHRRSLGVPAADATRPRISLATLIPSWLPLRSPSVHLVAEMDGRLVGSARAISEPHRSDWVIIELDADDGAMAAEIRWHLLTALVAEGGREGVVRFHVACADARENLELFGQAGFMAYAQEEICYRPPEALRGPGSWLRTLVDRRRRGGDAGDAVAEGGVAVRAAGSPDAWHLFDLWTHATPPAIARIEDYGAADWEGVGHEAVVPRSSLNPLLHFGTVGAWLMVGEQRAGAFAQHGSCREGPHYLRFLVREGVDGASFLREVLHGPAREAAAAGILAPVRTYESAGLRAATSVGFEPIGRVTLLVREVRAQARQPALVPVVH
ncbi:MAG TPA: hypothetical protein VFM19_01765 [Candidatus Limnocylindria bacterium]|nr:hypothetical protein [Candidatus Limnocylindria bacterium]